MCSYVLSVYVPCKLLAYTYSAFSAVRIGEAGAFVATQTGPGGTLSAAKSGPPDRFWLPNLVLRQPVLARWDHFWQPRVVRGDHFWRPKSVRGTTFGNFRVTGPWLSR